MGLVQLVSKFTAKPQPILLNRIFVQRSTDVIEAPGENGFMVLSSQLANRKGIMGALARKLGNNDRKEYELEPIGAFVWSRIQGRCSGVSLVAALQKEYKLSRIEAETSLAAFLEILHSRGLIILSGSKK